MEAGREGRAGWRRSLPVFPPVGAAHHHDVLNFRLNVLARCGVCRPGAQEHGHDLLPFRGERLRDAAKHGLVREAHAAQRHFA